MSRAFIIAEPGGTHEGLISNMRALVDAAAAGGADCFKSQWVSDAATLCARRQAPEYLTDYGKLQYPIEWHAELRALAREHQMQYACTVYLPGDAAYLAPYVDSLKISSFEAGDVTLITEALATDREVFVSLGMGTTLPSVLAARCQLLHCISSYPAPLSELQLHRIGLYDGFSDHSHDVRVGAWAVCQGATVLETHLRLATCDPKNKDYAVAFTPVEFRTYCRNVREVEQAMGTGRTDVQPSELPMLRYRVYT